MITKNSWQNYKYKERESDRYDKYFSDINIHPWRKPQREIVVIGLSDFMKNFWDLHSWERDVLKDIYKQMKGTNLKIHVRSKPKGRIKGPAKLDYTKYYGFVCHANTAMSVEGLVNGIPVFVHPKSIAAKFSTGYNISDPWMGDRQPFFNHVAYSQFMVGEMKSGEAWSILNE